MDAALIDGCATLFSVNAVHITMETFIIDLLHQLNNRRPLMCEALSNDNL